MLQILNTLFECFIYLIVQFVLAKLQLISFYFWRIDVLRPWCFPEFGQNHLNLSQPIHRFEAFYKFVEMLLRCCLYFFLISSCLWRGRPCLKLLSVLMIIDKPYQHEEEALVCLWIR